MSKRRKKFTKEFKLRAIELSYERETVQALGKELGINPNLIYRWRRQFEKDPSRSFPGEGNKAQNPEEKKVSELEKRLAEKEMELQILKKAIGIFSKSDRKSTGL